MTINKPVDCIALLSNKISTVPIVIIKENSKTTDLMIYFTIIYLILSTVNL